VHGAVEANGSGGLACVGVVARRPRSSTVFFSRSVSRSVFLYHYACLGYCSFSDINISQGSVVTCP